MSAGTVRRLVTGAGGWRPMGKVVLGAGLIALCLAAQCPMNMPGGSNMPGPSTGGTVSFANDIQPIFTNECIDCHVTGGFALMFPGVTLKLVAGQSFNMLVNQKSGQNLNLTLVVPGDSANSLLFQKVSQDTPPVGVRMPFFQPPLSATDQALIRDWIDQGANNN